MFAKSKNTEKEEFRPSSWSGFFFYYAIINNNILNK